METNNLRNRNRIRAGQSLRLSTALVPEAVDFSAVEPLNDSDSASSPESAVLPASPPGEERAVGTVKDMQATTSGSECRVNC